MSNVTDGQRTGRGLAFLRRRYERRAAFLAYSPEYRDAISDARKAWNSVPARANKHRVTHFPTEEEFLREAANAEPLDPDITGAPEYARDWAKHLTGLASRFWPWKDHFYFIARHPALAFVEASMYVDPRILTPRHYFAGFGGSLISTPTPPDPFGHARDAAERDALAAALRDILHDDPARLESILEAAGRAAEEAEGALLDHWGEKSHWYLEFLPDMSANDLKQAAGFASSNAMGFNAMPLDSRIRALAKEGKAQQGKRIAWGSVSTRCVMPYATPHPMMLSPFEYLWKVIAGKCGEICRGKVGPLSHSVS